MIERLSDNDQIVFKYVNEDGDEDAGYPFNPNGSKKNIAGICNPAGNVFGMMPHPERVTNFAAQPDWYRNCDKYDLNRDAPVGGDGMPLFESVVEYISKKF